MYPQKAKFRAQDDYDTSQRESKKALIHKGKSLDPLRIKAFLLAERVGFEPTCRSYRQTDFESFPAYDFWWKLSEDGSTQRKPKSCGILRILASVFRFYLNPQGFPSSSHFCPEL